MERLTDTLWNGVALRRTRACADPDAPARTVALPTEWEDAAAAALAALAPGTGPVSLPRAAEAWIARVATRGVRAGTFDAAGAHDLSDGLRALLMARRGAPGAETWSGARAGEPRFVLNLPAFLEPDGGIDLEGLASAATLGVRALDALGGGRAVRLRLGFADLAGLLAGLGLGYATAPARAVAAGIAAVLRGAAEAESGRLAARLGAREPVALLWPAPPGATVVPGLAEAARAALDAAAAAPGLRHAGLLALAPADAAEALLGAETAGMAPAAGPTHSVLLADGSVVEAPTRAALRADPSAVAAVFAPVDAAARAAMRDAVGPFLHAAPPVAAALPGPARVVPVRATPRRAAVTTQVSIGGQRVALRTAEAVDGTLVEIGVGLARDTVAGRGLMDAFAQAVSIGLAHGAPLAAYVDAFAYARMGPAGAVEGDADISRANSAIDWAFRRLARDRLGRTDLASPPAAVEVPELPLELPPIARKRLRLVG